MNRWTIRIIIYFRTLQNAVNFKFLVTSRVACHLKKPAVTVSIYTEELKEHTSVTHNHNTRGLLSVFWFGGSFFFCVLKQVVRWRYLVIPLNTQEKGKILPE
jgi:hypothetical protein